jgi:hypothetical protein
MLPVLQTSGKSDDQLVELADEDIEELHKLVRALLVRASSPTVDVASTYADAPFAAPSPDTALPLLAALLVRVPALQLQRVFPTPDLWQQLAVLLRNVPVGNPRGYKLRCAAMSVAATLCQTPALASALFESGGLVAVLESDLMHSSKVQISPAGLSVLEIPHPAILLSIMELLMATLGALPTHRMVLSLALNWVEQHHRNLLELLQWVSRLPIVTVAEPRPLDPGSMGNRLGGDDFGGALQAATTVNSIVEMSAGGIHDSLLLVFCSGGSSVAIDGKDVSMELISIVLSGRCWNADLNASSSVESRDRVIASCYRCASLFCELYASLSVAVQKCSGQYGTTAAGQRPQSLLAQIARLAPIFEPALALLLSQMAAAELPRSRDTAMQDAAINDIPDQHSRNPSGQSSAPGVGSSANVLSTNDSGLYASEATRLSVCMHILHAWRHDASTTQILTLLEQCGSTRSGLQFGSSGSLGLAMNLVTPAMGAAAVAESANVVSQLITVARSRVNVLCIAFVHACHELLAVHPVSRPRPGIHQHVGDSPHLQFDGPQELFRHLLFIVEVSLHLLQTHVSALILGGLGAAPTPGAPRMPLVLQYLRVLQQFIATVGGKVVLAEQDKVRTVDLAYAARAAERVEQSFLQLQSL